jgi:hypothetical protein
MLNDPVTFRRVVEWFDRETRVLLKEPGGEFLRTEIPDQLHATDQMLLSPVPTRRRPRRGHHPADAAGRGRRHRQRPLPGRVRGGVSGQPRRQGLATHRQWQAWQVDHIHELRQGGQDNFSNYLPVDPRLHGLKSDILMRCLVEVREGSRIQGEQVELTEGL